MGRATFWATFFTSGFPAVGLPDLCSIVESVDGRGVDGALRVVDEHVAQ
jgi:hypothetical protein